MPEPLACTPSIEGPQKVTGARVARPARSASWADDRLPRRADFES